VEEIKSKRKIRIKMGGDSVAAIDATRGASFGDDDFGELREFGLQAPPDPGGDVLAGGVFEAGDFVEIMVVQLFPERLEGPGDVGVIHEPAELGVAFAGDDDFSLEAVAVQAAAFVRLGEVRQQVRGFKLEGFA